MIVCRLAYNYSLIFLQDVYIYDFIATIKVCQTSLYWMYEDKETTYNCDKFRSFTNLLDCSHKQIHIKWITDLNDNSALLSFVCHGEQIHAEHKGLPVDREVWTNLLAKVKVECIDKWNALQFKNFMLRLCL